MSKTKLNDSLDNIDNKNEKKLNIMNKDKTKLGDSSGENNSMTISAEHQCKQDISGGCAPCPFCKSLKKSLDLLAAHIVSEHKVKIQSAIKMSEIMYAGEIPKSEPFPASYTCQQCFKKMDDPVRINAHAAKHGIVLGFSCPECHDLKPASQELAVHLVEEHDTDYEYAVNYTSGTGPVLAKIARGKASVFSCSAHLLYFLRKTQ